MNEIYYNKTGKDLWNVSKRDMERNLFVWLLKINIGATGASISPLMALIGFGGYFYAIPAFKIIKIKKHLNMDRFDGFKKTYPETENVPRPENWSGWTLEPTMIEFWLKGSNRIHERLRYNKELNNWEKKLLNP